MSERVESTETCVLRDILEVLQEIRDAIHDQNKALEEISARMPPSER